MKRFQVVLEDGWTVQINAASAEAAARKVVWMNRRRKLAAVEVSECEDLDWRLYQGEVIRGR